MRVCLLASGSKGNAIYIETGETRLLLDAGLSARQVGVRLAQIGVEADSLHGLLVSHEHNDHCCGVGPLSRKYRLPVFMNPQTRQALPKLGPIGDHREFDPGDTFCFRDLEIETIPLAHDATPTVGYLLNTPEGKVGVATDLGVATRLVADRLRHCRILILESNYDEELLRDGPYPWHLKQRIRSRHGHLSNNDSAALLDGLLWDGLEGLFLAHLSETNNTPQHAESAARQVLGRQSCCAPNLIVGSQAAVSSCLVTESAGCRLDTPRHDQR